MGDQWELCNQGRIGGPMRWGTNENRVERATLGDQWDGVQWEQGRKGHNGVPMRWGTNENRAERVTLGDQWDGGPMSSNNAVGTYEWEGGPMEWVLRGCQLGDQWDGGPLGLAEIGWINEKVDQYVVGDLWIGGPIRWGTIEMGDQWDGDWWVGGPMRWGTNEMEDQWYGGPILRPSYLHNGISYTGKMSSLYWIRALITVFIITTTTLYSHLRVSSQGGNATLVAFIAWHQDVAAHTPTRTPTEKK